MKKLLLKLDNYRICLSVAFSLLSIVIIIFNIISLLSIEELSFVRDYLQINFDMFIAVLFCSYIVYSTCGKFDKSLCATTALLVADCVCYVLCDYHFSPVLILLLSYILSALYKNIELIYAFCASVVICLTISLMIGLFEPIIIDFVKNIALLLSSRPSLFSSVNNFYTLFFSTRLEDYVFNSGIGASMVINDTVITGVKNVFEATINNPLQITSQFLSGKYFVNIFVAIGLFLNVYARQSKIQKATLILITLCSVVFGNNILLSIYIFLLSPVLYIGYLLLIFICNVVATLLDLRMGFLLQGSIVELFNYSNNIIYFVVAGLIIFILSYFVFKMILVYFNNDNKMFLSKDAKRILSALGGKNNITNIENDHILVKNANLINILKLDCEIYGNKIVLLDEDMQTLKENL